MTEEARMAIIMIGTIGAERFKATLEGRIADEVTTTGRVERAKRVDSRIRRIKRKKRRKEEEKEEKKEEDKDRE